MDLWQRAPAGLLASCFLSSPERGWAAPIGTRRVRACRKWAALLVLLRGLEGASRVLTDGKVSHHSTDSSLVCRGTALLGTESLQHCESTVHLVQTSGEKDSSNTLFLGAQQEKELFPCWKPNHLLWHGSVQFKGKTQALEKQNKQGCTERYTQQWIRPSFFPHFQVWKWCPTNSNNKV